MKKTSVSKLLNNLTFAKDFHFGVATSAYQIEGSHRSDKAHSHWDQFAAKPNTIADGSTGAIACDHINHYQQDLNLIQNAHFDSYRFSFSWPRIISDGKKAINNQGLSFYDALLDSLLKRKITPFATLYHWDLPAALADKGGWCNRDTTLYFADYADIIMRHFGNRLHAIATINEPWCVSWLGHYYGKHAPGLCDIAATAQSAHYILLAHGQALEVMRSYNHHNLGIVLNREYATAIDSSQKATAAAWRYDGIYHRWFDDALFKGHYPMDILAILAQYMPNNFTNDLQLINQPLDWVGLNYYTRAVVHPDVNQAHIKLKCTHGDLAKTDMGWEIYPQGLGYFLRRMGRISKGLPIYVTENGLATADKMHRGIINDCERINYFYQHLAQVSAAIASGVAVKGYFVWTLLDNFEWAHGYQKRFGLVHVDHTTFKRTPKISYFALRDYLMRHRTG